MRPLALRRPLLAAALVVMTSAASAMLVTIDRFPSSPRDLDDQTLTGIFQGNALLPARFQINSAAFVFSFSDDGSDPSARSNFSATSSPSAYVLARTSVSGPTTTNSYVRFAHTTHTQLDTLVGESAQLSLGTAAIAVGSGSTALVQNSRSTPGPTSTVLDQSTGTPGGVVNDYFTETSSEFIDAVDDYTGSFDIADSLTDPALLAELLANRSLGFSLSVMGDLELTSARLILDVSEVPVGPGSVPEPAMLALTGLAAGALAVTRRRDAPLARGHLVVSAPA
jgi:hypothetical protein